MSYTKEEYKIILVALENLYSSVIYDSSRVFEAIQKTEKIIESLNE